MTRGDVLVVASPLCAGISGHDIRLLLRELGLMGVTLGALDGHFEVAPDQDGTALVREASRLQNRAFRIAWEKKRKT